MIASRRRRRVDRARHRRRSWPVAAATLTLAASCAVDRPWDQPVDHLLEELARGNHAVLSQIDFVAYPPSHALALGQEAPLYLAKILLEQGRAEGARRLLELQTRRGPNWARARAAVLLARLSLDLGQYRQAAAAARRAVARGGSDDLVAASELLLTSALYRQREDEEVLDRLGEDGELASEELLMRAVARHRTGRRGWDADLLRLAQQGRASQLHERAWAYLTTGPGRNAPAATLQQADLDALRQLMEGKSHLAGGNRRDAVTAFEGALAARPRLTSALLAQEMGAAYRWLDEADRGARSLRQLAQSRAEAGVAAAPGVDAAIGEQLARLARDAGDYPEAVSTLLRLQRGADSATARDRYTWLLLDIYLNRAPSLRPPGPSPLATSAASWADPGYFADLYAQQIARSVAARDWPEIGALRAALEARGDAPALLARASYVLARASQAGLTQLAPAAGGGATELLSDVAVLDAGGYYGRLAALWLRRGGAPAAASPPAAAAMSTASAAAAEDFGSGNDVDRFVAGLFRFGLFQEGMATVAGAPSPLSTWVLREASIALAAAGLLRESIGMASRVLARPLVEHRAGDRERGYPLHYRAQVEQLELGGMHDAVFYGLVREESRFDAEIVSSAGAVGLTQLMPATAADEARRMRLTDPLKLTDPGQNLTIGAAHLARLYGRLDGSVPRSLMAYNAGLSRVRGWDRAYQGLPLDLYVEALPFAETRGYVRKILTSTVQYAAIYWDMPERQAAALFYDFPASEPAAPGGER